MAPGNRDAGRVSEEQGPDLLLLDEMFAGVIADRLVARGIDCRAITADPLLRSRNDADVLMVALLQGRVLVTNNVPDFEALRRSRQADGLPVPNLIYTSDTAFPRSRDFVERLTSALEHAANNHLSPRQGGALWLQPRQVGTGFSRNRFRTQ